MGDNREVNPSGQELIEGSTIAGEISSVNHTTPCPSAPPIEGRVKLSDDQKIASKRAAGIRYHKKRKRKEDEMMEEMEELEEYSGKLELESRDLKILRDGMEAWVDKEDNIIQSQLKENYAGQNTEVQKARINFTGETSTGQDGLKQEMNQAPITSNADTILGENASMNLQTLPRSAQPAGSSGLPDDKRARERISDKKRREKGKWTTNAVAARIKELKEKNVKMELDNAVLKAEANLLRKQLDKFRNIRKTMALKDARRNAKLEKFLDGCSWMLPLQVTGFGTGGTGLPVHHPSISQSGTTMGSGGLANENSPGLPQSHVSQGLTHNHNQGSTLNTQLPLQVTGFGTGGTGLPVHHPSISQSGTTMGSGGLANENSPGLPQSHVSQGLTHNHNQGSTLNTQLPLQVTGFGTGGTGLAVHHPSIFQSGITMGSGCLANENSPGLSQSHVSQGLTHLPWGMTPDNTFDTWEAGSPVHHPPVYVSETTIRPEGPAIEDPLELPQSPLPHGWPYENNIEQPDSTYGDQFIEFSGCSNNIDGSYI